MTRVAGSYFSAGSSMRETAHLCVASDGQVLIELPACENRVVVQADSLADTEISARMGNTPRYIDFRNGDRFESKDNNAIDALLKTHHQGLFERMIHHLESRLQLVLVMSALVLVFIWAAVRFGIPLMADITAQTLPVEVSQYLGQGTLELLDESVFERSHLSPQRQQQLKTRFQPFLNQYPEYRIKVDFRHSEEIGANAVALPGGQIIFTDAMVELAQSDDELVAILAHEMGHVVHRHLLRRVLQSSGIALILLMVTGDVAAASSLVVAIPTILLELSYSRQFEIEADDFAHDFMQKHNIEHHYFAAIMTRLMALDEGGQASTQDESGQEDVFHRLVPYLSTHPMTRERIRKFE